MDRTETPPRDAPRGEVLVLLPTYNERATLPATVAGILHHVPDAHLLIIDDGSPDGTGRIADELAADPRVSVHHRTGKLGLGTAYSWGFQAAQDRGYRYAVEMDSDGSHLAAELPALLAAARAGAGLVIGTRWIPGGRIVNWPWYRRWISRTGTSVARLALRSSLHDLTSGFRVLDTRWLQHLDLRELDSQGYAFQVETAWSLERLGCPIAEVPITFVERTEGRSKMSVGIVWEALAGVLRWGWRLRFPRREP
ncbi:polyprenol monophosphomannose synthase [Leucobacter chromiireducens]|uniref:Polyprenol monophosphomannose synthase n=1 Tax=Leucobacter chromiireducens subsp. solipictus TaxID=398235 RepID=A0ABS1SHG5_9MICO|nr:polyprenol monophosphomannose synthase [Leucobacter chromiireducens]MBL3678708.1 polyprenol monophosphomannose synthase [Leucobacter chromiireducens subsp. solipictus]